MMRCFVDNEDGAFSAMMAILGLAILMSLALVVDGGRQLGALTEAVDVADNAARVGAQHVDVEEWRETGVPVINGPDAEQAIRDFMILSGYNDRDFAAVVVGVPDTTITVQVTVTSQGFFFPDSTKTATQTAEAVDSVLGP